MKGSTIEMDSLATGFKVTASTVLALLPRVCCLGSATQEARRDAGN